MSARPQPIGPNDLAEPWVIEAAQAGKLVVLFSQQERLNRRDEAIRAGRHLFSDQPTVAAKELAATLDHAIALAVHLSPAPEGLSEHQRLVRQVLILNQGRPMGWRQLVSIFDGVRCT